jgi:hypothetical protein
VIHNSTIMNNTAYEVYNNRATILDAELNWWGYATGPDTRRIGGLVDYVPWLLTETGNDGFTVALSLVPPTGTTKWANGQTFDLTVHLDVSGINVNTMDAWIKYDAANLEVDHVTWNATDNPFDTRFDPEINNTTGVLKLVGGKTNTAFSTCSFDIATITFKTKAATASTSVYFMTETAVVQPPNLYDFEHPINVLTGTAGATVTIDGITLTYVEGANGTITGTKIQPVNYGASGSEVIAVPNAGYHFVKWSDNNSTIAARTDTGVTASITTTASFAANSITITLASGGNGTVLPVGSFSQAYGATGTTIAATPSDGYHFVGWEATTNPTYVAIASPTTASTTVTATTSAVDGGTVTITATFAINTYSVAISASGHVTSITPTSPQTVNHGSGITFTVTPVQLYYIFSTTRNSVTTEMAILNRNLGGVKALEFLNITEATTIVVNIYRRGDIARAGTVGLPDGTVDIVDLNVLISQWRQTSATAILLADLNCDLSVNISDLSMMMSLWGNP